jgi:fatty acid desaturase
MAAGEQLPNAVLRQVAWRDLVALTPAEVARELALPLPWLAASLAAAAGDLYPLALVFSFVFFLAGLRIVHGACHYAIGLSRRATEIVLFMLSLVMLGSMHVVRWNHLRHHRSCLATDDIEAMGARGSAWRAILVGPLFPVRLHHAALTGARSRERRWMLAELVGNLVVVGLVAGVLPERVLLYHLSAMAIGQCLTAFFAVWTVHHDCTEAMPPARTIRHPVRSLVTFNMFFHVGAPSFPADTNCASAGAGAPSRCRHAAGALVLGVVTPAEATRCQLSRGRGL